VAYRLKDPGGFPQPPLRDSAALRKTDFADENGQKFSANPFAENTPLAENTLPPRSRVLDGVEVEL
jgi:hypothetical protein